MTDQLRTTWLAAEFFTFSSRISGRVNVRHRLLADQLNDGTSAFLQLEDAYVSSIERPAEIVASHPSAILRKDKITAVFVARQEDSLQREQSYGSYFGTVLRKVFLTVPAFEIRGYLRLSSKMDLRTILTTGTDDFVPLMDGQMQSSIRREFSFASGAILVNKDHIEAFWIEEDDHG
jgi:hypothetical protein